MTTLPLPASHSEADQLRTMYELRGLEQARDKALKAAQVNHRVLLITVAAMSLWIWRLHSHIDKIEDKYNVPQVDRYNGHLE